MANSLTRWAACMWLLTIAAAFGFLLAEGIPQWMLAGVTIGGAGLGVRITRLCARLRNTRTVFCNGIHGPETLRINAIETLTLAGVRAPDRHSDFSAWQRAELRTKALTDKQRLYVVETGPRPKTGNERRRRGFALLADGRLVNAELVRAGMALATPAEPDAPEGERGFSTEIAEAEAAARAAGAGIWRGREPRAEIA